MTYAIPFFFTAALYRQILSMVLILTGYNLAIRHKKIGYPIGLTGFITHIHLIPIAGIYALANRIYNKKYTQSAVILTIGAIIALKTDLILAIGILSGRPQPSLYTQLFTITNPLLLFYGLKNIKKDFSHILLILLLITMPLTDQSRGMIFFHITIVSIAYDKYKKENTPKYYIAALITLIFLWSANLINFLINSMIKDGAERSLDLSPMIDYLFRHR